jgi:hypothetical protein
MRRSWRFGIVVVAAATPATIVSACSGDADVLPSTSASTGGSAGAPSGGGGSGGSGGDIFDDAGCSLGEPCGDGGICTEGGICCEAALACGTACCQTDQVCSFQECVVPGDDCFDDADCQPGWYCEYALGEPMGQGGAGGTCQGGVEPPSGKCLPEPPECGRNEDPGDPPTCIEECEYVPPTTAFDPVLKYSWGGEVVPPYSTDVMMTPIVVQLDDDNCDGKVSERDIPEIAFSTFTQGGYYRPGTLHVISIVDNQVVEKWTAPNAVQASTGLAAGDLDNDGVPEIVACIAPPPGGVSCCDAQAQNTGVVAFRADGTVMWQQTDTTKVHCGYESPAIADPDQSGQPQVLVGLTLLDGATGAVVRELDPATSWGVKLSGFADLDGDGGLDVTDGQRAWRTDGTVLWDLRSGPDQVSPGYHAVGDLDKDGTPEVVVVSSGAPHGAHVLRYDAQSPTGVIVVRENVDINNGLSTATFCGVSSEYGGGPPTIADFDGDGFPDVGAAGAVGYVVLDGQALMDPAIPDANTILWFQTTQDCSSAVTGSSVFDFNGDGAAEVVYSDEVHLWMYDGTTGQNLIPETCLTTGTLWEYPVIADVDNDGQADIVVAANAYALSCNGSKQSGIYVFGSQSQSWVRTRRIWNQHTYHITNVDESGAVPAVEPSNWLVPGLDNFRQNKQPGGEFAAPDLVVSVFPACAGEYGLFARVRNIGQAAVPPGVVVGFYLGDPQQGNLLGQGTTTQQLFALGSEDIFLPLADPPAGLVVAVVDDGSPPHTWVECRTDNNESAATDPTCGAPN